MAKIVVLGAGGFIGKHLVESLAALKGNKVYAFDRYSSYKATGSLPFEHLDDVTVVTGNFYNRGDLYSVLYKADYVFHLISTTTPATSSYDPLLEIDTNVRPSVELFELCAEHRVKKIVYLSSGGAVYGDIDHENIQEDHLPAPRSPYGIGKATIENYLRYFKHISGIEYIVYRVANPYGPGQNIHGKQGVIPIFLYNYLAKKPITILGDGSMVRDYIYIDDLVRMIVGSYRKKNKHESYNLGSGQGTSVNELIKAIEDYTGLVSIKFHEDPPATYVNRSVLDISRFVEEFKIAPETPLTKGMQKTWDYVNELQ
jgi:UDP-glucose 4-epimerase